MRNDTLHSFKDFSYKLLINYKVYKEHPAGKKKGDLTAPALME